MATGLPLAPIQANATTGATVTLTTGANTTSVSSTISNTVLWASNIRVTNGNTVLVFVRVSIEAAPTAAATDIPLAAGGSILLQNPASSGVTGIAAVNVSGTAGKIYFTPCEGGSLTL
jgi:hypothetical protein